MRLGWRDTLSRYNGPEGLAFIIALNKEIKTFSKSYVQHDNDKHVYSLYHENHNENVKKMRKFCPPWVPMQPWI